MDGGLLMVIAFENLSGGMGTAAFLAFLMGLCNQRFTATQFALLSAFASVGRVWVATNAGAANAAVGNYFMAGDILMTMPMDPAAMGSASGAPQAQRNYGMSIAAMSQYAKAIGMTSSSAPMFAAMVRDASDGVMNGMMGSTPISMGGMGGGMMGGGMMGGSSMPGNAGTSGLATAMSTFVASTRNASGVAIADMQVLIDKLNASNGTIQ